MFNLLFTNFLDLQRHEQASFSEQRQAYLHKLHADGMGIRHLRGLAGLLIAIDELLALRESDTFEIPLEYIVQKTSEWDSMTRQQRCDMRVEVNFHCRFLGASKRWLTYLGRLDHRYYPEDNIISKIFPRGYFRVRHLVSPMYMERLAYLEACMSDRILSGACNPSIRREAGSQSSTVKVYITRFQYNERPSLKMISQRIRARHLNSCWELLMNTGTQHTHTAKETKAQRSKPS